MKTSIIFLVTMITLSQAFLPLEREDSCKEAFIKTFSKVK